MTELPTAYVKLILLLLFFTKHLVIMDAPGKRMGQSISAYLGKLTVVASWS